MLGHLLDFTPNISSLSLPKCSDWDIISRGALSQEVLPNMVKVNRIFVKLYFSRSSIDDETVIEVVKLHSGSLRKLNLSACRYLSDDAHSARADCSKLQQSMLARALLGADALRKILLCAPDLRYI